MGSLTSCLRYVMFRGGSGEVSRVDVGAEEGVWACGRRGDGGLEVAHPQAVCGADVKGCSCLVGKVDGREDQGSRVCLLEAVVKYGQAAYVTADVLILHRHVPFRGEVHWARHCNVRKACCYDLEQKSPRVSDERSSADDLRTVSCSQRWRNNTYR